MGIEIDDGGPAFPFGQVGEQTGMPINGYHNDEMRCAMGRSDLPTEG